MTEDQKKFELYLTVLRFLTFKITSNLKRINLDIDLHAQKMVLTAFYLNEPSEIELELLDDIETNSNVHIPNMIVESQTKLVTDFKKDEKFDFVIFAVHEDI